VKHSAQFDHLIPTVISDPTLYSNEAYSTFRLNGKTITGQLGAGQFGLGNFARAEDNANLDKEVSAIYCSNSKLFAHCKKNRA